MPARAEADADRRPIYNARRVDRRRALAEPANDNSLRVRRNEREYTDYTPANDDAPGTYPTTSERYRAEAARRSRRPSSYETLRDRSGEAPEAVYDPESGQYVPAGVAAAGVAGGAQPRGGEPRGVVIEQRVLRERRTQARASATDRAISRGLGLIIQGPVWFYYGTVQLTLSYFLLVFFGATAAFQAVAGEGTWVGAILGTVGSASEAIFGVNVTGFLDPQPIYMLFQGLMLGLNAFVIALLLLIYTIVGRGKIKPIGLSGRRGKLVKLSLFIGAILSCFPLFSFLPMIPLWTLAVWRFPR